LRSTSKKLLDSFQSPFSGASLSYNISELLYELTGTPFQSPFSGASLSYDVSDSGTYTLPDIFQSPFSGASLSYYFDITLSEVYDDLSISIFRSLPFLLISSEPAS